MTKWEMITEIFEVVYEWDYENLGYKQKRDDNCYRHILGFKLILFLNDNPRPENMLIFDYTTGKSKYWESLKKDKIKLVYNEIVK